MTRNRRSFATVAAVVLALSACTSQVPQGVSGTPQSPTVPPAVAPPLNRTPQPLSSPLEHVDTHDVRMPFALEESVVVDPGWTELPHEFDGILLAPTEREDMVVFSAMTVAGHGLWTAQRPLDAAGFAVTVTSQGRALAVLTDTTDHTEARTASAYDLETGELVWGPVDVPGPLVGPGVVFAQTEDSTTSDGSSLVALNPDSGAALSWGTGGTERVLGEFAGEVLVERQGHLELRGVTDGAVVWTLTNTAWDSTVSVATDSRPRDGLLIVDVDEGSRVLISLATGLVIADGSLDAVFDSTTATIVATHPEGLRAFDTEGKPLWANPKGINAAVHSAYGALVYTQDSEAMRVHNAVTGAVAYGYQDSGSVIAVPEQFFQTGAAVISVNGRLLLATSP